MLQVDQEYHAHSLFSCPDIEGAPLAENEKTLQLYEVIGYMQWLDIDAVYFAEHGVGGGSPYALRIDDPLVIYHIERATLLKTVNRFSTKYEKPIEVGSAIECSIVESGGKYRLDLPKESLEYFDIVIASLHELPNKADPLVFEPALMSAIENNEVDIIGHPHRYIEFHPNDWSSFLKIAKIRQLDITKELEKIDKMPKDSEERANLIRKIVGKVPFEETDGDDIKKLNSEFNKMEKEYWAAWERIFNAMAINNKVLEININSFRPGKEFYIRFLRKAAEVAGLQFSIATDFHNLHQLDNYKSEYLHNKQTKLTGLDPLEKIHVIQQDILKLMTVVGIPHSSILNVI